MLPLRLLVLPFESLSLGERAQALVLARDVAELAARLLGPGGDRGGGVLVWQRLVIEEALLRQVVTPEDAVVLMRRSVVDDRSDARLDAFLSAWVGNGPADARQLPKPPLTLVPGGAATGRRRSSEMALRASASPGLQAGAGSEAAHPRRAPPGPS